jgi:hypothetical protein
VLLAVVALRSSAAGRRVDVPPLTAT